MKISSLNINDVNKRLPTLLRWLRDARPDVVCLQELKCEQRAFPVAAIKDAGYHAAWVGQRTWNGVAILSKTRAPEVTRIALPGDAQDHQSRYIEAAVAGVLIGCLYLPNGNPQPGPKFDYKLAWFERLIKHARAIKNAGVPAVLAGDYNVVPTEFDIYENHSYGDDALLQPESRKAFARLLKQGWTDALRDLYPDERIYTYWSYLRNRWPRNKGLRLDYFLVSPDVAARLDSGGVDAEVRGYEGASDHAPVWIKIRGQSRRG
ncbi:MAG TPA: exodeoxyribonuclease III [Hyphomicrobiaceae bacterium]|nr:exodeoxyribonuclease III [Hyphomicrobiaceae bacterium]